MVDLKAKPFNLDDNDIDWVNKTIERMTAEEKIGQFFVNLFFDFKPEACRKLINEYHSGGARYIRAKAEEVYDLTYHLQQFSKIPMLVACNCDLGGDGACKDGTYIASAAQVEASGSEKVAYNTGYVSGSEAEAIGCNWNFDPCADILLNSISLMHTSTTAGPGGFDTSRDP